MGYEPVDHDDGRLGYILQFDGSQNYVCGYSGHNVRQL
jgi:hypothetical protein